MEKYWKNDDAKLYHFIGKDNIVFHCIMFPIILMEHGNFVLPENVPANEFLNLEGKNYQHLEDGQFGFMTIWNPLKVIIYAMLWG